MTWQEKLLRKYKDYGIEIENATDWRGFFIGKGSGRAKIRIVFAHTPKGFDPKSLVPEDIDVVSVIEGFKQSSSNLLSLMVQQNGCGLIVSGEGRYGKFRLQGGDNHLAQEISNIIYRDGFYDVWEIETDAETLKYNRHVIDACESHKEGEIITDDRIRDLQITLATTNDVNDFINSL